MKKYIGYIPAALFTAFYLTAGLTGASITMSMALLWVACFWIAALLLHKGLVWGCVFGVIPGLNMILRAGSDLIVGSLRCILSFLPKIDAEDHKKYANKRFADQKRIKSQSKKADPKPHRQNRKQSG